MRGEIFGDELAGEAGSAVDDDVEFRRRHIQFSLRLVIARDKRQAFAQENGAKQSISPLVAAAWIASLRSQ
jgi:hypothetical protein